MLPGVALSLGTSVAALSRRLGLLLPLSLGGWWLLLLPLVWHRGWDADAPGIPLMLLGVALSLEWHWCLRMKSGGADGHFGTVLGWSLVLIVWHWAWDGTGVAI